MCARTALWALYARYVADSRALPGLAYRDEPWLAKGRSLAVSFYANAGLVLGSASFLLRLSLYSESAGNSTTVPCAATAVTCMLGVGMVCVAVCLRVFVLYTRTLHAHIVQRMRDDDASSVSSAHSKPLQALAAIWYSLVAILSSNEWTRMRGNTGGTAGSPRASRVSEHKSIVRTLTKVGLFDYKEVQHSSTASSLKGLALLGSVGTASLAVIILPVVLTNPLYTSGCVGCDLYLPVLVACVVMSVNALMFCAYLFWLMRATAWDDYGVKWELFVWLLVTPSAFLVVGVLLLTDPSSTAESNVFAWDWLSLWPVLSSIAIWDVWPLVVAHKQRKMRDVRAAVMTEAQLQEGIAQALNDAKFEALCERLYVVELLRFLKEEAVFREDFFEKSADWRKARAQIIVHRYIASLAPMQVNLSAELRREIERNTNAADNKLGADMFDKARLEVVHLLKPAFLSYHATLKRTKSVVASRA